MSVFRRPRPRCWARVDCVDCGPVAIGLDELAVRCCIDTHEAAYRFRCRECGLVRLVEITEPGMLRNLLAIAGTTGIKVESWYLSPDVFVEHDGPPLTEADVIRLRMDLDNAELFGG